MTVPNKSTLCEEEEIVESKEKIVEEEEKHEEEKHGENKDTEAENAKEKELKDACDDTFSIKACSVALTKLESLNLSVIPEEEDFLPCGTTTMSSTPINRKRFVLLIIIVYMLIIWY